MKKAQIQQEDAKCIVCLEGITNPICPECLAKEVIYWEPRLKNTIVTPTYKGTVRCIFCGKEFSICAHCYCRDLYGSIEEQNSELAEEFVERFNFRLKEELF